MLNITIPNFYFGFSISPQNPKTMNKTSAFFKVLALVFMCFTVSAQETSFNFEDLLSKIQSDIWNAADENAATWVSAQNTDGSWSDLNYTPKTQVSNSRNHMTRLFDIAQRCTDSGSAHYNNTEYVQALKRGLQFWLDHAADDANWWYNKIFYPQKLGEIMLMMRNLEEPLPRTSDSELSEDKLIPLFSPTGASNILSRGSGANAADIALHYLYRAVLTQDEAVMRSISNVLEPTLAQNIAPDIAYQDHGPQLQISSYGYVFCNVLIKLAKFMADTPAAFNTKDGNFSTVLRFIREVQIPATRGQHWDYSVTGRGISRPDNTKAELLYLRVLAEEIDTVHADYYNDALSRLSGSESPDYNVPKFHKHYWASDYTQHSRSDFLFTVRNVSSRTVECEVGNNENVKGNYLSYGANFIAVDGDEYYNIMPVWDWSMIPGTTVKHTTQFINRPIWGSNYGNTSFVGGVSDGLYGASVLNQNKDSVQAKKSWFFFDDEVVCLGAGIEGEAVRTTINQCIFDGPVSYVENDNAEVKTQSINSQEFAKPNLKWLRHGKITYFLPQQENVKFTLKSQKGSWYSINKGYSSDEVSKYVFKMWIEHGNSTAADYAYIVVPNMSEENEAEAYDVSKIQILENNSKVQAVYHQELDLLQAVFHTKGTVHYNNRTLSVNQASVLMLKGNELTIADPAQVQSSIKVVLTEGGTSYTHYASMPAEEEKGASVCVRFRLPTSKQELAARGLFYQRYY